MRQNQSANGSLRAGSCTSCMPHQQIATSGMALQLYTPKGSKALGREGEVLMNFLPFVFPRGAPRFAYRSPRHSDIINASASWLQLISLL